MKQYNKVIALIIVLTMIFSLNVCASENESAEVPEYESQAQLLMDLNILPEDYGSLDEELTRAEAVAVIVKLMGFTQLDEYVEGPVFSDVEAYHSAAASIKVATDLKILSGYEDGSFHPDDPVTLPQVLKMLLSAMNFQAEALQKGGYPVGFLVVANEKRITKGIDANIDENVSRGTMVQLVYNSLDVDILQKNASSGEDIQYTKTQGNNILTQKHKIFKETGRVTGNYFTMLTGESTLKKDQIEIDDEVFRTVGSTANADQWLGYTVTYYYKEDDSTGDKLLLSVQPKEGVNDVIEVKADNIEAYKNNTFSYWVDKDNDDQPEKVKVSKIKDVIYNGKSDSHYDDTDFVPDAGKVVLLDNDNDEDYDVVFITHYENYVVNAIDKYDSKIYDKYRTEESAVLEIDPNDIQKKIRILKDDKAVKFEDILISNVLSVAQSKDGDSIFVYISTTMIDGTVIEIEDNYIYIDGQKLERARNLTEPVVINDTGKFYLDIEGKVAAVDVTTAAGCFYGYLMKTDFTRGLKKNLKVKVFDENGKIKSYTLDDTVEVNGVPMKDQGRIQEILKKSPNSTFPEELWPTDGKPTTDPAYLEPDRVALNNCYQQVVMYEVSSEGIIDRLETSDGRSEDGVRLDYPRRQDGGKMLSTANGAPYKWKFKQGSQAFDIHFAIDEATIIFNVPRECDSVLSAEDDYKIKKSNAFSNDWEYIAEGYNMNDIGIAKVAVVYSVLSSTTTPDINTSLAMVDKVTRVPNEDGETVYKIYAVGDGAAKVFTTKGLAVSIDGKEQDASVLKRGVVFRYIADDKNRISSIVIKANPYDPNSLKPAHTNPLDVPSEVAGQVYAKNKTYIRLCVDYKSGTTKYDYSPFHLRQYNPTIWGGKMYVYDRKKDKVYVVTTLDEIKDYKSYGKDASFIWSHTSGGDSKHTFIFNL